MISACVIVALLFLAMFLGLTRAPPSADVVAEGRRLDEALLQEDPAIPVADLNSFDPVAVKKEA